MPSQHDPLAAKRIFAKAIEMDAAQRAPYLDEACRGESDLRTRVEQLIVAHEEAGPFLDVATDIPLRRADGLPTEVAGDVIDRYKLLQKIGEGGMGSVWMARQTEPVQREVALKLIKLGMDSKSVVARFEAERQALALMDHPNIAKVLDGGCTERGRPYFVMELVRGMPVTQFCDEANLDTVARLQIFRQVCYAVQHAHQKGVIHRDIKPSNVLVTLHDGTPVPKVIDFGVAKATHAELTQKTLFTEFRQMIGTPDYMAPEQAELSALDVDTRADVYSLGVLLYELLTGSRPFDTTELLQRGYAEMLRVIREEDPPKPSMRISTIGETQPLLARSRQTKVKSLSALIRGELDWIVMRAMEKERTRRYATAGDFAADIERHLHHEPVQAGPPTTRYRLRKYVARNRLGVLAGSLVVTSLIAGTVISACAMLEAQRQRDVANAASKQAKADRVVANQQRERASQAATRAEAVVDLVRDMLGAADPAAGKGPDYTVRQALDDFGRGLDGRLDGQPQVAASIHRLMANSYLGLGQTDEALYHGRIYEQLCRDRGAQDEFAPHRSKLFFGEILHRHGDIATAEKQLRSTLEELEDHGNAPCGLIGEAKMRLAGLLDTAARYRESVDLARQALPLLEGDPELTGNAQTILGAGLGHLGEFAAAEAPLRAALAAREARYGVQSAATATLYMHLSLCLGNLAKYGEALEAAETAETIAHRSFDSTDPQFASAKMAVGQAQKQAGSLAEAEAHFGEALIAFRAGRGGPTAQDIGLLSAMANVQLAQLKYDDAERTIREAIELSTDSSDKVTHSGLVGELARVQSARGRHTAAERSYRRVIATLEEADPDIPFIHMWAAELGRCLYNQRRHTEAEKRLREAVSGLRESELVVVRADALTDLAAVLYYRRKAGEGSALAREAIETYESIYKGDHPKLGKALGVRARCLLAESKPEASFDAADRGYEMLRRLLAPDHPVPAVVLLSRAKAHLATRRPVEAEADARAAAAVFRRTKSANALLECLECLVYSMDPQRRPADVAAAADEWLLTADRNEHLVHPLRYAAMASTLVHGLSLSRQLAKRAERAEAMARKVLAIRREQRPPDHPETLSALASLAEVLLAAGKPAEAEPLARQCMDARTRQMPDSWLRFNAMSLLGGALADLGQHDVAEPLLREACEKMQPTAGLEARRLQAVDRLVSLYEAMGETEKVERWREEASRGRAETTRGSAKR